MKTILVALLLAMVAVPVFADPYYPLIPVDGVGNPIPCYWNGTAWVIDTGVVNMVGSITATVATSPSTWSDSVTARTTASDTRYAQIVYGTNSTTAPVAVRAQDGSGDNYSTATVGLATNSQLYGYDRSGNNWDRVEVIQGVSDSLSTTQAGLATSSRLYGYNATGSVWDRVRVEAISGDSEAAYSSGALVAEAYEMGWVEAKNGSDRMRAVNSVTKLLSDTAFPAGTTDTFNLLAVYNWIYVSSDTDILVALNATEANAGMGDVQAANQIVPYNFQTQYVYVRTKTGLALNGGRISVRGMR